MSNIIPGQLKARFIQEVSVMRVYEMVSNEDAVKFAEDVREVFNKNYPDWKTMDAGEFQDLLLEISNEIFFDNSYYEGAELTENSDTNYTDFEFMKDSE